MLLAQAEHVIDFRTSDKLITLYQAGLRPWKGGDEIPTITDELVTIWLPESRPFSMEVDRSSFHLLKDDSIYSANLFNEHVPVEQAVAHAKEIAAAIGASVAGLDEKVTAARSSKQREGWGVDVTKGPIDVRLVFQADHFPRSGLRGYVNVYLNWKRTPENLRKMLRDEPVKPPLGYEHLSMDPPPLSKEPWPKYSLQHFRDLLKSTQSVQTAPIASPSPKSIQTPATPEAKQTSPAIPQPSEGSSSYVWVGLVVGAIVSLVIFQRLRQR